MNILYLGPKNIKMIEFLTRSGDFIIHKEEPLLEKDVQGIDYIVSYGYRYMINKSIVKTFYRKAVNLHISYLPWNRGADPNLWSFLENTPKGVSIHYIDAGLDTGEIIVQKTIAYSSNDTLKTTYTRLKNGIEDLFFENWDKIKQNKIIARRQRQSDGTYHKSSGKKQYEDLLVCGWDTNVTLLINAAIRIKRME